MASFGEITIFKVKVREMLKNGLTKPFFGIVSRLLTYYFRYDILETELKKTQGEDEQNSFLSREEHGAS